MNNKENNNKKTNDKAKGMPILHKNTAKSPLCKIKIAFVITSGKIGGAETQMMNLAKGLDRKKFDVSIISIKDKEGFLELEKNGIKVYSLGIKHKIFPFGLLRLKSILSEINPDIIHSYLYYDNILARLCKKTFNAAKGAAVITGIRGVYDDMPLFRRAFERRTIGMTDCIISNSEAGKAWCLKSFSYPSERIHVISNGKEDVKYVKLSAKGINAGSRGINRISSRIDDVPFRLLYVGRLWKLKNIDILIDAISTLEFPCTLDIIGDGPEKDRLIAIAKSKEVDARFHGYMKDAAKYMKGFDAFVLPSSTEGCSNSALEAMQAGVPVIATAVGGMKELIIDRKTGVHVVAGDHKSLADAISLLRKDRKLSGRISKAAKEYVRRNHSMQNMIDQHEIIYEALFQKKRGIRDDEDYAASVDYRNDDDGGKFHNENKCDKRIKVFHLITRFIKGGADMNTMISVKGLDKKRFDVTLGFGAAYDDDMRNDVERHGIMTRHFSLLRHGNYLMNVLSIFSIYRFITKNKFDIVHTHSTEAGFAGRIAARLAGVPIIIHTAHGVPFSESRGFLFNRVVVGLERYCARFSTMIVSNADMITERYLSCGIGQRDRYVTIYSGIDLDTFINPPKSRMRLPKHKYAVMMNARLAEGKGHVDMLHSAEEILKELPDTIFIFVGDGEIRKKLETLAEKLKISNNVIFCGRREDVPSLLTISDVLVLPSYREGTPRVISEAMAAGIPAIATDIDGIPEQIIDGETGFLIAPGDRKMLAEKIVILLMNKDLRSRFGKAARERSRMFSQKLMVKKLNEMYDDLAEKNLSKLR